MNQRPFTETVGAVLNVRLWVGSDLSAFGQFQSILHVNAQIADRAVDLGMTEKPIERTQAG